jgi:MoxR-like ATPase
LNYAVSLAVKTRPGNGKGAAVTNQYLKWGAGPRASQYLVVGAKTHAALHGKYSPDIEDVTAVAHSILQHGLLKTTKPKLKTFPWKKLLNQLI